MRQKEVFQEISKEKITVQFIAETRFDPLMSIRGEQM